MRQAWEPEDLIEVWTLLEDDMKRVQNKSGETRLGFALLLKFLEAEARFPESAKKVPDAAVECVAQQVKVPAEAWADYDWQSKAIQRHRGHGPAPDAKRAPAPTAGRSNQTPRPRTTLKRGRSWDADSSSSMTWCPRSVSPPCRTWCALCL